MTDSPIRPPRRSFWRLAVERASGPLGDGAHDFSTQASMLEWLRASLTRRIILVALGELLSMILHAAGLVAVPPSVLVLFTVWLLVAIAFRATVSPRLGNPQVGRTHMAAQMVDIAGALAITHLLGATLWYAPLILAMSVSLGGLTLARRQAFALGLIASAGYAAVVLAEIRGIWPVTGPFAFGAPPNLQTGIAAIIIVSVVLFAIGVIQRGFFRQVADIESRHTRLLETAVDIIATFDRNGRFLSANRAFEELLGWKRDAVIGVDACEYVAPEDRPGVLDAFAKSMRGETSRVDARIRTTDGAWRVLSLMGAPILDEEGAVVAVLGIARDVTLQRAESARLTQSERQLRLLMQSMNETVCTFDANGHFSATYGRYASAFHAALPDIVGKTPVDVFGPEVGARCVEHIREALTGRTSEFEQELVVDGTPRQFTMRLNPLRDDSGATIGVTGVAYDVTEQHHAERERDVLRASLEESRRIEAIGRLVSGIAHEINNPLAAILTFAEQLRAEARTPVDAAALEAIHAEAMRSRAIVRDLLAFVRPSQQRPVTVLRPVPLVGDTVRTMLPHITSLGAQFKADIKDDGVWIVADPQGFEQVVTNLVLNAVQSAGAGGTVELRTSSTADSFVMIVQDSGPGIPDSVMPHMFEPFFTTKPVGRGTGLGLSVVRGIVQHHGGTIRAENRPLREGGGARFIVTLPRTGAPPVANELPAAHSAPPRRGRVLLVDDEDSIRVSLRRFFTRKGWEVYDARDGVAALEILRREGAMTFALILCDLRMPGMSGPELHATLSVEFPEMLGRMVVVTGDMVSTDAAAFLASSHCRVLEKPFELKSLGALAEELLASMPAEPPSETAASETT